MKMTFRPTLLSLCLGLALSAPAMAQAPAINDAGEQALRTQIQTMLDKQKNARQMTGGALVTEGDLMVEQADTYYAVTLPAITLKTENGESADIGIIAINAIPDAAPGNWKLSVSVPTPITWNNAAGTPVRKLDIGKQRLSGLWSESLGGFSTLDAAYDNLTINDLARQKTYRVASAGVISNLKETAKGIWSGQSVVTIKGLDGSGAPAAGKTKADSIVLTMDVKDLSAAKQQQMREKIGAFAENTNPKDLETMSPAGQLALYNMVVDMMRSAGSGFALKADLNNFSANIPAQGQLPARSIALKDGSFGFDLTGLDVGKVTLGLLARHNGLVATPDESGFVPTNANIDMKINNLPFEELVKIGQDSLKAAGKGGAAKQFAGIQAMISLPQVLSQAGANVVVTNSTFANAMYDAKVGGTMTADMTSTAGAVGKMKAEIHGLDNIIAKLQQRMNAATTPIDKGRLQKSIQTLTVFNLAGQAEKRGDKMFKIYDFELTKSGQMLLNGSDLSLLTGTTTSTPKAR